MVYECDLASFRTYLLTGCAGHSSGSASVVATAGRRHKHGLHSFLQGALLSVDNVAHQNVHQGVLHQRHEDEHRAAGHEHVNSLYCLKNAIVYNPWHFFICLLFLKYIRAAEHWSWSCRSISSLAFIHISLPVVYLSNVKRQ